MSIAHHAMRRLSLCSTILPALLLSGVAQAADAPVAPVAPVAAKTAWQETRHGTVVTDDYRWLQKKTDPAVIDYLNAENAYTAAVTAPIQPLADKVFAEIKGRIQEVDLSVPVRIGNFYYYTRTEAGKQYAINCRRPVGANGAYDAQAAEEILLDQNKLAEGQKFFSVRAFSVSPNEQLLAYTTDTTGFRQYELHIKDLKTGQLLTDSMPRVTSLAWAADNATLLLVQEDATTKRSDRLFRLALGGTPQEVYHEAVEQFSINVGRTQDKKFFVLRAGSTDTSEISLLPTDQPNGVFKSVLPREKGHRYSVEHRDGLLYILTNKNAKNFRIVSAPLSAPQSKNWKELVPHDKNAVIKSLDVFQNYLVVMEKSRALNRARIYDFASKHWKTVQFDDPVYLANPAGTPEFNATQFRMSYQSPVTPPTVIDVSMKDGKRTVLKQQEVVGGYDASRYTTQRLWVTARDGVQVPLWVVYKKGVKLDGSAPLLLYSYGSYGISTEAGFSIARLSLLDRGVIYVQAHIRGGTDMGEAWHEDGMLMKKKNTFNDFIDSADYLVREKWTSPNRLIIQGGSAGGLLMGAVVNMRPELFHAVHAAVPFVDVMNTMMDASLPLTTGEYLEWGNPNEKAAYDYMLSYSPYDNIARKNYPAMLVTTGLNDSQVMYWEPAKYVAKLRAYKTDNHPLLLKTNMGAGHGGASGRYDAIAEGAFNTAWMLSQWGITE
ncbi:MULTISPECIES: S9 family peptidase [unclassified Janthinobacterium]|uniref:S9 family peptidase n=1 Tax=unclassified Janthinobacterium TaxID=2610881 RepID=UPI0016179B16|nr:MULTISPECIES: S9 family peptidase [unclassified Janthinobacterium]MBB5371529.1 oligopeptidase B [Janthinobacterium sp. K2C7]MBB5384403.1 oligopeptidase B [Janthinobacterium sp. K2Li3]MBB5389679.1 oligopeptidase B [Janthinobacterium sp. K2E3]